MSYWRPLFFYRCDGCESVLRSIERQIQRANAHKDKKQKQKTQVEAEVTSTIFSVLVELHHSPKLGSLRSCYGDSYENVTKQEGLIRKPKALYVRYKVRYTSSPYSAKQQREMTKFKVLWSTWAHDGKFFILCLNLNAILTCSVTG